MWLETVACIAGIALGVAVILYIVLREPKESSNITIPSEIGLGDIPTPVETEEEEADEAPAEE